MADAFPESSHVRELGLAKASDREVWEFARTNGFAIVSKDTDFHDLSVLHGHPPKVIWIRRGNCSTGAIADLLRPNKDAIRSFDNDETASMLVLL